MPTGENSYTGLSSRSQSKLWAVGLAVLLLVIGYRVGAFSGPLSPLSSDMSLEQARGRSADTLSDIPARGWMDIFLRVYQNLLQHRAFALAAGVTFHSLLAIFPGLAAVVALYGLFADPAPISGHLDAASGFLPGGTMDVARDQLTRVPSKGGRTLGLTLLVGLA